MNKIRKTQKFDKEQNINQKKTKKRRNSKKSLSVKKISLGKRKFNFEIENEMKCPKSQIVIQNLKKKLKKDKNNLKMKNISQKNVSLESIKTHEMEIKSSKRKQNFKKNMKKESMKQKKIKRKKKKYQMTLNKNKINPQYSKNNKFMTPKIKKSDNKEEDKKRNESFKSQVKIEKIDNETKNSLLNDQSSTVIIDLKSFFHLYIFYLHTK